MSDGGSTVVALGNQSPTVILVVKASLLAGLGKGTFNKLHKALQHMAKCSNRMWQQ